ncbi:hypothetical protein Pcinc_031810 [Petrolisthes cinctipes]|uniref:Nucleolar protein 4 n=1 Tax=Petrolisthes cinctipes TaxID=88211 RepID=A0AAE1K2H0_PETCI|nr:hypothetical protein Pcinc_031810 [Petrolisthes cinctipes]
MVHQVPVQDRAPRKRDRRTAGLMLTPGGGPDLQTMRGAEFKGEIHPPPAKLSRLGMYETYQPWVLQTYGDSAKTKTITRNKYQRILQILRGDYVDNETSKFKLWVKGRGFRIGTPPGYLNGGTDDPILLTQITQTQPLDYNPDKDPYPDIYVQTGTVKSPPDLPPSPGRYPLLPSPLFLLSPPPLQAPPRPPFLPLPYPSFPTSRTPLTAGYGTGRVIWVSLSYVEGCLLTGREGGGRFSTLQGTQWQFGRKEGDVLRGDPTNLRGGIEGKVELRGRSSDGCGVVGWVGLRRDVGWMSDVAVFGGDSGFACMWELGRTGVGGEDDGGEARLFMIQVITVSEGLWRRWIFQLVWDQPKVPVWGPSRRVVAAGVGLAGRPPYIPLE